ncbi:zinc finger protein 62 [Aedes albopictus]|uniref:C2H2-type domain-containing protein n=1 Tax=Aedes albopictus TaxID=7160 RepID=A0ABM1ZGM2_AEDAL|nr:zinc finger protein 62-like [Aedes albopictus]XP_019556668.2 zinc finger protein 62-like [Aedes albopictus]
MTENKERNTQMTKWTRGTQVDAEDIDMTYLSRTEDKPIEINGTESLVPQCRFCLRRVSRENLKVILRKHCIKAHAAFQIRVFLCDAYPLACSNCMNMIDIISDYKLAVAKAHNLLLDKRLHLENEGWDDPMNIEFFNQCKSAVEMHRVQVDQIYDELMVNTNTTRLETKIEFFEDNVPHVSIQQSDNIDEKTTVQSLLDSEFIEVETELVVESGSSHGNTAMIDDEGSELSPENETNVDPNTNPPSSRRKRKAKQKKIRDFCEFDEDSQDEEYKPNILELSGGGFDETSETSIPKRSRSAKTKSVTDASEETKPKKKRSQKKRPGGPHRIPVEPKKVKFAEPRIQPSSRYKPLQLVLCDLCGDSVYPETIEGHRNRHLGIKPYSCPAEGCDWTFYGRSNMSTHVRRVHPENGVPTQKCDVCGKHIKGTTGSLNVHRKRHFQQERKFVCTICGKGFTLNRYLKQHSVVHTGLFPHECSICGKKFNNKWSMKTHEKNVHGKKSQD